MGHAGPVQTGQHPVQKAALPGAAAAEMDQRPGPALLLHQLARLLLGAPAEYHLSGGIVLKVVHTALLFTVDKMCLLVALPQESLPLMQPAPASGLQPRQIILLLLGQRIDGKPHGGQLTRPIWSSISSGTL